MKQIAVNGYEIHDNGDSILVADRATWGLGMLMIILGVWAALALVVRFAVLTKGTHESWLGSALLAAGVVLLGAVVLIGRIRNVRRSLPIEDVEAQLRIDFHSQVLQDRTGKLLARLEDVTARMHIDWWTRGAMRIVVLRWPGGRRTIFRSFGRRQSLELLAFLSDRGLDAH